MGFRGACHVLLLSWVLDTWRALCGTLIKPQLLWIHSLACMLHVNENVRYKGRDEKEMRMGVRGQEVKEEAIINLSNHRPVTLFVLSTLWYFKTNNANTTDLLFLIKEMKRPSKKLIVSLFGN